MAEPAHIPSDLNTPTQQLDLAYTTNNPNPNPYSLSIPFNVTQLPSYNILNDSYTNSDPFDMNLTLSPIPRSLPENPNISNLTLVLNETTHYLNLTPLPPLT